MLNYDRFAKLLALAGSDVDAEALAALRKARTMLAAENLSFTDVAQSLGATSIQSGRVHDANRLRKRLAAAEESLVAAEQSIVMYLDKIARYERELTELRWARSDDASRSQNGSLKRTRAEIAATMRGVLGEARLSRLSDREIARRTGISPQAVGNWRRRVEAERAAAKQGATGRRP